MPPPVSSVHFSSQTDQWSTPPDFFAKVEAEFGPFDLDPCADASNAKAPKFYTKEQNGLSQPWGGKVFVNPPYGRRIGHWVEDAVLAIRGMKDPDVQPTAEIVVMLLPARTDTRWWHDYVIPYATEIRFIKGRLKFGGSKNSAPFPSALVIYGRP